MRNGVESQDLSVARDHRTKTLWLTLAKEAGEINRQRIIRTAVLTAVHRNDDTTAVPLSTSWYYKLVRRIVTKVQLQKILSSKLHQGFAIQCGSRKVPAMEACYQASEACIECEILFQLIMEKSPKGTFQIDPSVRHIACTIPPRSWKKGWM